ncbi:MAG TPA: dihydropteroate synthase [bacterium]|nr:dihydropteroate synthase [bacterium]
MIFRARQFEFRFPRPALVMGIVNVTPDSFSDGGKFLDPQAAVAHALELAAQGAEILDIGGESSRPSAEPVSEAEELRRVIPVIERLTKEFHRRWGERPRPTSPPLLSIDTLKPAVARAALAAGASIVNDVAANRSDNAMWKIVAEFQAGYVCMHASGPTGGTAGSPGQLHGITGGFSTDPIGAVADFFYERLERLNAHGIASEQVVLDPGIGFGKTLEQNLQLLAGLRAFAKLNRPILLGVSRKSFIEKFCGAQLNERLPASLACATLAIADGTQIIRTHDVAETVQAVRMAEAVLSRKENA